MEEAEVLTVRSQMVSPVVTISPGATVKDAFDLMRRHDIRHLPVVAREKIKGLVTERSIQPLLWPSMIEEIKVSEAMVPDPITVEPGDGLEKAARLFYEHKIGCLPVVEGEKVVGILSVPDLLAAFIEFMGLLTSSLRLDIVLAPREDALEEVTTILRRHGGSILSVGMLPAREGRAVYSIRSTRLEPEPLRRELTDKGHRIIALLS